MDIVGKKEKIPHRNREVLVPVGESVWLFLCFAFVLHSAEVGTHLVSQTREAIE